MAAAVVSILVAVALLLVIGSRRFVSWGIRIAYWTGLRRAANNAQRWLFERGAPVAGIPPFSEPQEAVSYIRRAWTHRTDKSAARLPWADWSSRPEVTQARIASLQDGGDCDDYHTWVAAALGRIKGVSDILLVGMWAGSRAHTVLTYWRDGRLYLVDYDIIPAPSYRAALELAHARRTGWKAKLSGWVFETPTLRLVAVWPEVP